VEAERAAEVERGREAERPSEIPARGWRDVLARVRKEVKQDNVSVVAAGVAFYTFLAIFPGIAALVSLWGLFADPAQAQTQVSALARYLPGGAAGVVEEQLAHLASQPKQSLGIGAIVGILLALWSASKGVSALIDALNIAYDETERRGFFERTAVVLLFTLGGLVFAIAAIAAVVVLPALLDRLGIGEMAVRLVRWLRWPALALVILLGLALLYRYGPSRARPRWRWVTGGSALATALWLAGSAAFSFYVSRFGKFNETYGSMAAIAILLTWLLLSAYVVILGAELNGELEHQTRRDTTEGAPQPMGRRGAEMADTLGEAT
jgi:membrane protein